MEFMSNRNRMDRSTRHCLFTHNQSHFVSFIFGLFSLSFSLLLPIQIVCKCLLSAFEALSRKRANVTMTTTGNYVKYLFVFRLRFRVITREQRISSYTIHSILPKPNTQFSILQKNKYFFFDF